MSADHPPAELSIGAIGHRLRRPGDTRPAFDAALVRRAMDATLAQASAALLTVWPHAALSVLTALAEGADMIAAESALDSHIPFDVLLPMPVEGYERTFDTADGRRRLRELMARARRVDIVDDAPDADADTAAAFARGAADLLARSHLLVAVWDGLPPRGRGGTGETVQHARAQGIPVVVIDMKGAATILLDAAPPGAASVADAIRAACARLTRAG